MAALTKELDFKRAVEYHYGQCMEERGWVPNTEGEGYR